jgi:23S rRNA pseudouridine2605 synthase
MQQVRRKAHARMRRLRAPGAAGSQPANPWYEVELSDARRDLLRQALFSLGHPVEKMKRVKLGPLELGDLEDGRYRPMEPREVAHLRRYIEKPMEKPAVRKNPQESRSRPAEGAAPARRQKRVDRHQRHRRGKSRRPAK